LKINTLEHRTYEEINLSAIQQNYHAVKSLVGKTKIMSVVKANAYGHGMEEVAKSLISAGSDYLAVANTAEAKRIRDFGIHIPILVFGNPDLFCIQDYFSFDLEASVSDFETANFLSSVAIQRGKKISVHFKIDTGMGRYGIDYQTFSTELLKTAKLPGIEIKALWSHLPNADSNSPDFTRNQLSIFQDCILQAEKSGIQVELKHIANSAGILFHPDSHFDMVRPGLILYGYLPEGWKPSPLKLTPAMSLISNVSLIKKIKKGTTVSYGSTWVADNDTEIAVVPIGYADGVLRILSNKMKVEINGKLYSQTGTVTMDNIMIDLGKNHNVKTLDRVTLFGNSLVTADDWANIAGTISWEILCSVTNRVPRIIKN